MAVVILLGSGGWVLVRSDGIKGEANPQLAWRWTPTAEERLLTAAPDENHPVTVGANRGPTNGFIVGT